MNWQPFRYNQTVDPVTRQVMGWESTPIATAMAEFEEQLATYFAGKYGDETQEKRDSNKGRTLIDESYYLALSQGMVTTADPCPNLKTVRWGCPIRRQNWPKAS